MKLVVIIKLILVSTLVALASLATWALVPTDQSEMTLLESKNVELQDEIGTLGNTLESYQTIASKQLDLAQGLRHELADSISKSDSLGDKLVVSEGVYTQLPKTIPEAVADGWALLDSVDSKGELLEAACFAHEDVNHYYKGVSRITDGVDWHGAPLLLMYSTESEKLLGIVLESTSPQPAGLWETHAGGHPGMEFPHSSLHFWFTDPPVNLSLNPHTHS
jgi:hypothetical protein